MAIPFPWTNFNKSLLGSLPCILKKVTNGDLHWLLFFQMEGFQEFETRRKKKFDKQIDSNVIISSKGLDEGVDLWYQCYRIFVRLSILLILSLYLYFLFWLKKMKLLPSYTVRHKPHFTKRGWHLLVMSFTSKFDNFIVVKCSCHYLICMLALILPPYHITSAIIYAPTI